MFKGHPQVATGQKAESRQWRYISVLMAALLIIPFSTSAYAISSPKNLEGQDSNIEFSDQGRIKKIWSYIPSNVITPKTTINVKKYPEIKLPETSRGQVLLDRNHGYSIPSDRKVYVIADNVRRVEGDTKYAERLADQVKSEMRELRAEVVELRALRDRIEAPELPTQPNQVNPIAQAAPKKPSPKVLIF